MIVRKDKSVKFDREKYIRKLLRETSLLMWEIFKVKKWLNDNGYMNDKTTKLSFDGIMIRMEKESWPYIARWEFLSKRYNKLNFLINRYHRVKNGTRS